MSLEKHDPAPTDAGQVPELWPSASTQQPADPSSSYCQESHPHLIPLPTPQLFLGPTTDNISHPNSSTLSWRIENSRVDDESNQGAETENLISWQTWTWPVVPVLHSYTSPTTAPPTTPPHTTAPHNSAPHTTVPPTFLSTLWQAETGRESASSFLFWNFLQILILAQLHRIECSKPPSFPESVAFSPLWILLHM